MSPETAGRVRADPDDPRHGTPNGYTHAKCRCDRCRKAHADQNRNYRPARRELTATDPRHGTRMGYILGCRCDACRAVIAERAREQRRRKGGLRTVRDPRATGR